MWTYLDTSAILKLVADEPESAALELLLRDCRLAASTLVVCEARRAIGRHPGLNLAPSLAAVLTQITLSQIDLPILRLAGELRPPSLRSLDAIHLATAAMLGPFLQAFVTYDTRLADAARQAGLRVVSPGAAT